MKADIHPKYAAVVFNDLASGEKILTRSTATSDKTIEWEDGNTYPVIDVEISSASHPFYTGKRPHHGHRWSCRALQRPLQGLRRQEVILRPSQALCDVLPFLEARRFALTRRFSALNSGFADSVICTLVRCGKRWSGID